MLLALWIGLGSSVLVLLVAAISIKNHKSCNGIDIEIMGVKEIFFLDKDDILKIINDEGIVNPAGKAVTDFNLQRLETVLKKNVWVKDAELFFDNNLVLHINILEKEPVARVFTNGGDTFYIDSSGNRMPLNSRMNVKLPVFTGFPDDKKQSGGDDSILIKSIAKLTMYILNNKFWLAQVAQVDITPDRNFEIIPTVGNHVIEFGNGDNYDDKFKRLLIFYKQVLSKTGIDTYSKISVRYAKQVIGTKKGTITRIDSVQALKNIRKMIEDARKVSEDSVYTPADRNMGNLIAADSMIMMDSKIDSGTEVQRKPVKNNDIILKPGIGNNKAVAVIKPLKKATPKQTGINPVNNTPPRQAEINSIPKAVMPKLNNNN